MGQKKTYVSEEKLKEMIKEGLLKKIFGKRGKSANKKYASWNPDEHRDNEPNKGWKNNVRSWSRENGEDKTPKPDWRQHVRTWERTEDDNEPQERPEQKWNQKTHRWENVEQQNEGVVRLSDNQLRKIIRESMLAELDRRKVMPAKYYEIFRNRVFNAMHGSFGDVERVVKEFFKDFKDKVPNEGFTIDNLMELADDIENGGDRTHERGSTIGGHKIKDADEWWGVNMGKFLEEKKVRLTETQLRKLIKESVKKAIMNEISSDMISRAKNKFYQKYGGTDFPGPDAKDFPKDEHGNLLYPKDKKSLASHYRNFDQAIDRAKQDEKMNDPVTREAMEIWNDVQSDVDWDITDDFGNEGCEVTGYIEVDGWEFSASGYAQRAGGLNVEDIEVEFKSPDGQEGSFSA